LFAYIQSPATCNRKLNKPLFSKLNMNFLRKLAEKFSSLVSARTPELLPAYAVATAAQKPKQAPQPSRTFYPSPIENQSQRLSFYEYQKLDGKEREDIEEFVKFRYTARLTESEYRTRLCLEKNRTPEQIRYDSLAMSTIINDLTRKIEVPIGSSKTKKLDRSIVASIIRQIKLDTQPFAA